MLFKSALVTAASGSIGGMTASHNRGGMYMRARVIPVNKFTPAQRRARQSLNNVAPDYAKLSEPDKESWQQYGTRIKRTGPLGDSVQLTAQQMYNRSKLYAKNVNEFAPSTGAVVPDSAPPGSTLPAFEQSPVLDGASEATQEVSISFDNTEAWANEDGASMSIYLSPPQGAGVNHHKGPFQLAAVVEGNSTTPPASPVLVPVPFPIKDGQKVWARLTQYRADGSLSSTLVEGPILVLP